MPSWKAGTRRRAGQECGCRRRRRRSPRRTWKSCGNGSPPARRTIEEYAKMTKDGNDGATLAALARRIDELESRAAIRDLVTDYCLGFDAHDWDRFISIWHPDAVWEIGPP